MVGVGTENVVMNLWPYRFCSMLGMDKESWGYSYRGHVQHDNVRTAYGPRFGQGTIIGVHLDMCSGTLEFFHNRRPLGIAFTGKTSVLNTATTYIIVSVPLNKTATTSDAYMNTLS